MIHLPGDSIGWTEIDFRLHEDAEHQKADKCHQKEGIVLSFKMVREMFPEIKVRYWEVFLPILSKSNVDESNGVDNRYQD